MAELGSSVLLDVNNGEKFTFARLNPSATLKLGKTKYSLASLIGCPFGATFETKGSSLERCSREVLEAAADEDDSSTIKDNRNLVDDNTAQALTAEEIHTMKKDGSSGQEIIKALIANSVSYETKTAFSQEKYKRKKQKKYAPRIIVRRPTARSVCDAYFSKTPAKIGFLRVDALSLILSLANVGEKSNVLILDMFGGLLTAAVAERLSGFGTVCSVYYGTKAPSLDIVNLLNFDSDTTSRIFRVPASKLLAVQSSPTKDSSGGASTEMLDATINNSESSDKRAEPAMELDTAEVKPGGEAPETGSEPVSEPRPAMELDAAEVKPGGEAPETGLEPASVVSEQAPAMEVDAAEVIPGGEAPESRSEPASIVSEQAPQRKSRAILQPSDEELSQLAKDGFTSLIIGTLSTDTTKIVQELLPLIAPSSPFVVYHTYLQPLADCMFLLQKERRAVNLQLSEPWLREYQVLPARTHPQMQMSATGGYILSGIRVNQQ